MAAHIEAVTIYGVRPTLDMMKSRRNIVRAVLIAAPLIALALWAASGRENLTKREKLVQVEVVDPNFGDTFMETQPVPGRILGYYVGLDVVAATVAVCGAIGGIAWRLGRRAGGKERENDR